MIKQSKLVAESTQVIHAESKWVDRIAMIRKSIQEGIPLNQIEQRLDWLDYASKNTTLRSARRKASISFSSILRACVH